MTANGAMHPGARARRLGEGDRCPICGATGGVSEDGAGYVCIMCGAPRVLVDGIVQRDGKERPLLDRARTLRLRRSALALVAALALVFGVVSLTFASVAGLLFGAVGTKWLIFTMGSLVPLGVSMVAWVAVRRSTRAIGQTLSEARQVVAQELVANGAARDAKSLERLMHLAPGQAEEMFGRAEVERLLEEPSAPVERLRVDTGEDTALTDNPELRRLRKD